MDIVTLSLGTWEDPKVWNFSVLIGGICYNFCFSSLRIDFFVQFRSHRMEPDRMMLKCSGFEL